MSSGINGQHDASSVANADEVRLALERILSSKHFHHAPKKQKFLRLISEFYLAGRAGELNEYLIGREVFDRDESYNPADDPIVRVGAHDVRKKLMLYYQNEGAGDEIKLDIPVGSYAPVILRAGEPKKLEIPVRPGANAEAERQQVAPIIAEEISGRRLSGAPGRRLLFVGIAIAAITLAVTAILIASRNWWERAEGRALNMAFNRNSLGAVWAPFLNDNAPTLLILSNPTVHRPVNGADPDVLTGKAINLTPEQESVLSSASGGRLPVKPGRPIQLIPAFNMYTGIGEAIGVYRLSTLLHAAGEPTILKQSRSVGPEDLRNYDVILLGSVYSNQWSKPLSIKENFVYTDRATIENLAPAPGEQKEYRATFDERSGNLLEDYALITVTPGVTGERTIMVLAGIYSEGTEAASEFVTSANYLNELNQRLRELGGEAGSTRYYQALLKVRVENSFPTKVSLLTVRELQAAAQ